MKRLVWLALAAAILAGAGWYWLGRDRNGQAAQYRLAKVERGRIVSSISSTGSLNAVTNVQVGSQVSGQIKELLADYNSEVKKDQVVARLDPETFAARVRQAEAELAVAKANVAIQKAGVDRARADLENVKASVAAAKAQVEKARVAAADAKRNLERQRALYRTAAVSRSQIDSAEAAYDQAVAQISALAAQVQAEEASISSRQAQLKTALAQVEHSLAQVIKAEAALNQARIDLDHTIIRSPVDGVVIERNVDVGQTVAASLQAPRLFTIAQDLRKMQLEANVDEADVGRVEVGQMASFTVDAFPNREFRGKVEQIRKAPEKIQNVVTYTVVITAGNPDLRLLPGMTANLQVIVDERADAIKVPNAALRFRPAGVAPAGAQAGNSPALPAGLDQAGRLGGAGAEGERLREMAETLGLSQDQQDRIRAAFAEARRRVGEWRRQGLPQEEIQAKARQLREQSRQAVLALLDPEQRAKFLEASSRAAGGAAKGRVYLLDQAGQPKAVEVVLGLSDGNFTEILRGDLRPGQEVVVGLSQSIKKPPAAAGGGPRFGL